MTALKEMCFEITGACPMACIHCSSFEMGQDRFNRGAVLSTATVKETIADFNRLGGEVLQVSGGEPLLHPDLLEILGYAKGLGLHVRLYTSGLRGLLPREIKPLDPEFAASLRDTGLDRVVFNLEGAQRDTHERITKTPGSFDACLASLKACKLVGLWVGVHFVPMKPNWLEADSVADLCDDLGVNELAFLRFVPQGRGAFFRRELQLEPSEAQELATRLGRIIARDHKVRIRTGSPMNFLQLTNPAYRPVRCEAGVSTCNITFEGEVVPCPAFKKVEGFAAGNVLRQPLERVWTSSSLLRDFRRREDADRYGECFAQMVLAKKDGGSSQNPCC